MSTFTIYDPVCPRGLWSGKGGVKIRKRFLSGALSIAELSLITKLGRGGVEHTAAQRKENLLSLAAARMVDGDIRDFYEHGGERVSKNQVIAWVERADGPSPEAVAFLNSQSSQWVRSVLQQKTSYHEDFALLEKLNEFSQRNSRAPSPCGTTVSEKLLWVSSLMLWVNPKHSYFKDQMAMLAPDSVAELDEFDGVSHRVVELVLVLRAFGGLRVSGVSTYEKRLDEFKASTKNLSDRDNEVLDHYFPGIFAARPDMSSSRESAFDARAAEYADWCVNSGYRPNENSDDSAESSLGHWYHNVRRDRHMNDRRRIVIEDMESKVAVVFA